MAHLLCVRRPLPLFKALRLSSPQPYIQRQCFSQSLILQQQAHQKAQRPRQQLEASRRVVAKQMHEIPSDVGILDQTFISPTQHSPSPFSSPKTYIKFKWAHLRYRFRDRLSLLVLWFSSPAADKKFFTRSITLGRKNIVPSAVALHQRMYTSFAEGNVDALREICTDGILETFRSRLAHRQPGEKVEWRLVRYIGSPRLVSHRGARIPMDGAAIRQAVVRIKSTQMITRSVKGKDGVFRVVEGSGREKDVEEFLVLQKMAKGWVESEWMVWGTTQETTVDTLKEWDAVKVQ